MTFSRSCHSAVLKIRLYVHKHNELSKTQKARGDTGSSFLTSTERLMFSLTSRVLNTKNAVAIKAVSPPTLFNTDSFEMIAGTEVYNSELESEFIFPDTSESFIKLPENWRDNFFNNPNIQYQGSRVEAKYVNKMLPAELNGYKLTINCIHSSDLASTKNVHNSAG